MLVSQNKIESLFKLAKQYKDDIKSSYNDVYKLTDPYFTIKDSGKIEKNERRNIDSTIITSRRFLVNFIMTSLFSRNSTWGVLQIDPLTYSKVNGTERDVADDELQSINETMQKNSELVCKKINQTNMYVETEKGLKDCSNTGTGIRKTILLNSSTKPFTYEYISPDNFYFLEDSFGMPTITFKVHPEVTLEKLKDLFGYIKGFQQPEDYTDEDDLETKINILEVVIPNYDEKTTKTQYYHMVMTEGMDKLIAEETLSWHPYRVFRWNTNSSNPWGNGVGRDNVDLFQDLEDYKALRKEHSKGIVNPPVAFRGNIDLMYKVDLRPGAVNALGDGLTAENSLGIEPINLGTNLIPVENDIADCRQRIREAFMAQPLGDVTEVKNRSATEMSIRHEMFRREFSGTYELLNTELLSVTFLDAYAILQDKGLLETLDNEEEYFEFSEIMYVNELTKSSGLEEVNNVINWFSINAGLLPEEQRQALINNEKFAKWSADKLLINLDVVKKEEDIKSEIEKAQQIQRVQALGGITNENLQNQVFELVGGK